MKELEKKLVKTNVDKLVELVNKEGKITVKYAAKKLKVSPETTEAWAKVLDDMEVIKIDYGFRHINLISRRKEEPGKEKSKKTFKNKLSKKSTGKSKKQKLKKKLSRKKKTKGKNKKSEHKDKTRKKSGKSQKTKKKKSKHKSRKKQKKKSSSKAFFGKLKRKLFG